MNSEKIFVNMYCKVSKNHKEIKSNKTKPPFFLMDKKL